MSVTRLYNYGFAIARAGSGWAKDVERASELFMDEDLAKSGLSYEDMQAYPISINLPKNAKVAYGFPYYDLNGKPLGSTTTGLTMFRIRCAPRDNLSRAELKDFKKYTQPARSQIGEMATIPYIPPGWWKPGGARFLIEGEKKAMSFAKRFGPSVRVMAIGGCDMWHHPDPNVTGLHPWIVEAMSNVRCGSLTIIPDGDIVRHRINRAYSGMKGFLERLGVEVKIINFGQFEPNKVDDWLLVNPMVRKLEEVEAWPAFDESELLENRATLIEQYQLLHRTNAHGAVTEILGVEFNIKRLFERHPYFKDSFRMNLDTMKLVGEYNAESTVVDTTAELQNIFGIPKANRGVVKACIGAVAYGNGFSPIKDWLNGLKWDGEERLDGWMIDYLGAEDTEYIREVGRKALIAAVARKMKPGCIVDFMTILKGPQGIGKSSAIRILFGEENVLEYTRGNAEGKDALMVMNSAWCVSDEELGLLTRSDRNKLKAFITIRKDSWRPPYAAEVQERPRQFVLWGSTNEEEFLADDETGHRRYAVAPIVSVDFAGLAAVREQLWAESVYDFLREGTDYSNVVGTSEAVARYVYVDPLGERLEEKLAQHFQESKLGRAQKFSRQGVDVYAIRGTTLIALLGMDSARMGMSEWHRLGAAMRKLGWTKIDHLRLPWDSGTNAAWIKRV